ncbi:hypothetical protein BDR07DRAFT_166259 [Suillus spraguei]|nr:hypothetical protein BDR07DRAFT_166259 [Suillus spraguei]
MKLIVCISGLRLTHQAVSHAITLMSTLAMNAFIQPTRIFFALELGKKGFARTFGGIYICSFCKLPSRTTSRGLWSSGDAGSLHRWNTPPPDPHRLWRRIWITRHVSRRSGYDCYTPCERSCTSSTFFLEFPYETWNYACPLNSRTRH